MHLKAVYLLKHFKMYFSLSVALTDQEEIKMQLPSPSGLADSHAVREKQRQPIFQIQELCIHLFIYNGDMQPKLLLRLLKICRNTFFYSQSVYDVHQGF